MDMSDYPVETRGLSKHFGDDVALSAVSLRLAPGTVTGLLGKNGAGKTTLIKCILGLLQSTEGECRVLGERSVDLSPEAKAAIGYVPQEPIIYPWMRIAQAISYQGAFYESWDSDLATELLTMFDLDERKRVGTLSVGQLQKLAILLAMASRPYVLLLDEPVAALDPEGRRDFLRLLLDMVSGGDRTVLLSTHITSDVERVCSHVAMLRKGEFLLHDDLDDLRESMKELRLTGCSSLPDDVLGLPGIVRYAPTDAGTVIIVRGDIPAIATHIRDATGADLIVADLSLEDVFLELHR